MLSEEEKMHIIEKVQFENEIRKELSAPIERKKFSWLNSKMFLLLIGSLITGILVPWFQYTHKAIEWKRQNEFDNINFRLKMMRDCLKEFVYLSAYTSEAYERTIPFMDKAYLSQKDYEDFEQQHIELQNSRFRQNAKVTSLLIHFPDANTLKRLFRDYAKNSSDYLIDLKHFVHAQYCISNPSRCEKISENKEQSNKLRIKIDQHHIVILNESYSRVIGNMKQKIGRIEDESEEFRL